MERPSPGQSWPQPEKPPREQAVNRVLVSRAAGLSEQEVKDVLHERKFENRVEHEGEIEKSEAERMVLASVLGKLPQFIRRYGGDPLKIDEGQVHFVNVNDLPDEASEEYAECGGDYDANGQNIRIYFKGAGEMARLQLARRVAHEGFHFNSFQSARLLVEGPAVEDGEPEYRISPRRVGLVAYSADEESEAGRWLNEAMTEKLVKTFVETALREDETFRDEFALRKDLQPEMPPETEADDIANIDLLGVDDESGEVEASYTHYSYRDERHLLDRVLDGVASDNPGIADREAAFDVFARAYFSGNLLEVARLVEGTYGKGSFRLMVEGEDVTAAQHSDVVPRSREDAQAPQEKVA
jgi:hypothetical protein